MFSGNLLNIFIEEQVTPFRLKKISLMVNVVDFLSRVYTMHRGNSLEVFWISNNKYYHCKNIQTWYC